MFSMEFGAESILVLHMSHTRSSRAGIIIHSCSKPARQQKIVFVLSSS